MNLSKYYQKIYTYGDVRVETMRVFLGIRDLLINGRPSIAPWALSVHTNAVLIDVPVSHHSLSVHSVEIVNAYLLSSCRESVE